LRWPRSKTKKGKTRGKKKEEEISREMDVDAEEKEKRYAQRNHVEILIMEYDAELIYKITNQMEVFFFFGFQNAFWKKIESRSRASMAFVEACVVL